MGKSRSNAIWQQNHKISLIKEFGVSAVKKILCPVDLYHFLPEVAEYALNLAESHNAEIHVLYVLEPIPSILAANLHILVDDFEEKLRQYAEEKMAEILSLHFISGRVKGSVVFGQPADEILKFAEKTQDNLIVMASHCRTALCRAAHGSVTDKVLANAKKPVLVVYSDQKSNE